VELGRIELPTYSMRTRIPGRLAAQAVTVVPESPGQSVGSAGCRKPPEILLRVPCGLGPEPPAASKPLPDQCIGARQLLELLGCGSSSPPWSVQSIIVRAGTGDHAEGLQYHVLLPTDDPLRGLNILCGAAGLQPLSDEDEGQDG
jgi:hypothetical protein